MHYPWWYVPVLTSPMLIAIISVIHVLISHYAVGGGLFLAVETSFAYRTQDRDYLGYLKRHAKFFVWVTVVLGAITGVSHNAKAVAAQASEVWRVAVTTTSSR